jgi:hypothetical protein
LYGTVHKQTTNNKKICRADYRVRGLTSGRATRANSAFDLGIGAFFLRICVVTGGENFDCATMQYPNGRMIYSYQSCAFVMVASLLLLQMAATAATSKPCLTKEEAKKLWPNEWLYWHTERHCWDHIKGTSGTYDERRPEPTQQPANVVPAPLPKQVTTTKERTREPEILYPTMIFNKANILEMTPLTMHQPWFITAVDL